MAMQFYASPEQIMRDRSEFARKGITRGRSVVVLTYADGVLFVAENLSKALHKVSEIYDRIGFAAVGRYNEFENLRAAGVRMADLRGYSYDRRDVTGRAIATAFAQTLGSIFTESTKPYEVEICIAEVGADRRRRRAVPHHLRRPGAGRARASSPWAARPRRSRRAASSAHRIDMTLTDALRLAVEALGVGRRRGRQAAHAGGEPARGGGARPGPAGPQVPPHHRRRADAAAAARKAAAEADGRRRKAEAPSRRQRSPRQGARRRREAAPRPAKAGRAGTAAERQAGEGHPARPSGRRASTPHEDTADTAADHARRTTAETGPA